ncbi:T9SS C-terminal target domain-containing protein [Flavobacteriaceae bacterium AU392]|nr:T9SS C-terminal target domain-containing protein [Flavobacteriaceae bacterium]RKM84925.1 T9SS C-terminal target domain-containing protein [Flavobacteriaceae bacterium AU392]
MKKKLLWLISSITIVALLAFIFTTKTPSNTEYSVEELREKHAEILKNSPFKETIKLNKKERKAQGLPPNRYYEQMWELSVNPSTGKLDDGELVELQNQIKSNRSNGSNLGDLVISSTPGSSSTNSWDERGPNDVGGRTRVMLFDPNDTSNRRVFAGGVSGGLWVNNDITSASSSWSRIQNVPGNLSVTSITVDPRNSNTWYVGTGEQYTAGDVVGNGVYKSTDGGNTWNAINIPPAGATTFDFNASNLFLSGIYYVNDIIAWDNGSSTELFVGVGAHVYGDASNPTNWLGLQTAGLYRSTNGGTTWSRVESANMQFDFSGATYNFIPNDFEIGADNKLWMGTITTPGIGGGGGGRVFSSTNGSTWTEAGGSPLTDSNRVEIAVSSTNANKMYALTQGVSSPVHIYSTTNGFASTSTSALPNDADNGISANDFTRGQAFYDLMIEVDPSNDNILYVGGIDLFRSTNSASSWTQISKWSNNPGLNTLPVPLVHADQHAMTFRPGNSNQAVFGNDGGIYYASNLSAAQSSGSAIGVRNNNYNVTQYVKAGIGPNGTGDLTGIFTAGAQDNGSQAFRNATAGINGSEELSDGDGFYTFVDKDGQYMIATFVNNVIYRFSLPWNGLGRRQGGATTLSNDQSRGDFVNPMGYDSDANRLLTNNSNATQNAIKSINVASNTNGSITNAALTASPTAFRASPFANNVWHVGLANGGLLRLTGVTNTNANFTTITTPFVGSISSIRYGVTANDLMVTVHNYGVVNVWSSSDAGATWDNKEGDLPNLPVRDILQNPLSRNEAIVATQMGVWTTDNFNSANPNWVQSFNGMSDASVTSFDYWAKNGNDNDHIIIASTYGRGVFTGSFTATTVVDLEAPSAPANLTASNITETTIDLDWSASTDNIGVTAYDVSQDGVVIATVPGTNYQATGLTANTTYAFSIVAKDGAGNTSSASNTINATTLEAGAPVPCTGPSVSVFPYSESFEGGLGLWTQSAADDIDWTQRSGSTPSVTSGPTGPLSASVGSQYLYTESSGNGVGFPNMQAILNSPCFDLSGRQNAQFTFDYHMFGATMGDLVIEISTDNGTTYSAISNTAIATNGVNPGANPISGQQQVTNGEAWRTQVIDLSQYDGQMIRLRISGTTANSFSSDIAIDNINLTISAPADTESPSAPESLVSSNTTFNSTDLSWGASTDNVGVTGYDVLQDGVVIATVANTTYQVTGLSGDTSYAFIVRAEDAAGNESANSNTVNVTTLTPPDTQSPSAPTNLTASGTTLTTTDLSWGASTDNVGVTGYDVLRDGIVIATVTGTNYQAVGLTESTSYAFVVRAEDAAGNQSGNSNTVNVTTLTPPDTQAPSAPTNLTASNTTQTSTDLSWTQSTDNVGVTSYDVSQDGIVVATVTGTNYQVTGLTASTSYAFTVRAEDAAGNQSGNSNTVNVTTLDIPTNTGCSNGINSFPYSEGFESGLGTWTQSTADDNNWTVNSGGTPSQGTGPSSAIEGSSYVFVEASVNGTGFPNIRSILNSPCFDLSNLTEATFTFQNHMFGSNDFGSIDLEISDDDGATWTSIWSRTGNQGNQWNTANVDLTSYVGGSVQLRFNRVTGGIWQADFALDNISLTDGAAPPPPACTGSSVSSFPYTETFNSGIGLWSQDTADQGNWTLDANGTPSNSTGPSNDFTGGGNYFFTEASNNRDPGPNATVNLISPCFDLTNSQNASFSFYYHMFGSNMGSLRLDVSDDNGSSWTTLTTLTGQQQGSNGAAWLQRTVDLGAYDGQVIKLRLSGTTGNGFRSDMAVDQLSLTASASTSGEEDDDRRLFGNNLDINDIVLYPNPVQGNTLNVSSNFDDLSYEVYNIIGQVVSKGKVINKVINVSELTSAVYHIRFTTGEETITKRFIKR